MHVLRAAPEGMVSGAVPDLKKVGGTQYITISVSVFDMQSSKLCIYVIKKKPKSMGNINVCYARPTKY